MSSLKAESLLLTRVPIAETGMLIRRPVAVVFEAIVNPEFTTQFWFTRSSGRLVAGRPIRWDWEMYDISIQVTAKVIEPNHRIVIEWPGYSGPTTVEWTFAPRDDGTFVKVTESGFTGTGDQLVKYVADSTQGFALMLAGLKALLEHGVKLNLVRDRFPKSVAELRDVPRQRMASPHERGHQWEHSRLQNTLTVEASCSRPLDARLTSRHRPTSTDGSSAAGSSISASTGASTCPAGP